MTEIKHGDWKLQLNSNKLITIKKLGESREYDVDEIIEVQQEDEYVFLQHEGCSFTQVKFEEDNFIVIDKFDANGDSLDSIGSHVFGEELEIDSDCNCGYCGSKCFEGEMCDEQQAGGFDE